MGTQDRARVLERAERDLAGWSDPERRMRTVLERDELALYCQPIVQLDEPDAFPIAEVLVRLREEEEAGLPPGEFFPVFEHFNMMPDLDRWVVERAARIVAKRHLPGTRAAAINISAQSLRKAEVADFIRRMVDAHSLAAGALCFEIDEADVIGQSEQAIRFSAAVHDAGCTVAADGFGYRAISFATLEAMRVDFVKVDGSITRNVLRNESALTKMQAIVDAARTFGARVIAEFVEDDEILKRLREIGVGYAQGFGVALPVPMQTLFQ